MTSFASGSSDDDDAVSFIPMPALSLSETIEEDDNGSAQDRREAAAVSLIEYLFLLRDAGMMERLRQNRLIAESPAASSAVEIALLILRGEHVQAIKEHLIAGDHCLSIDKVSSLIASFDSTDAQAESPIKALESALLTHLESCYRASRSQGRWEALKCLLVGALYLELYQQINYTGPELSAAAAETVLPEAIAAAVGARVAHLLEVDGEYSFVICQCLHLLFAARIVLGSLSRPLQPSYKQGIALDENGDVVCPIVVLSAEETAAESLLSGGALQSLLARHWFSARAVLVHLRSLQRHRYEDIPSLFKEACDAFNCVLKTYAGLVRPFDISVGKNTINGLKNLKVGVSQ